MSENQRERVRRLFLELVEFAEADRPAALARACGADAALRADVEVLLAADRSAGAFLSSPTASAARGARDAETSAHERAGGLIGRYKLLEQIGEGGMGTVWMAEQREPVKRRVALKIIKLGMDTKQVIARFEAERQALALMDHPHIAKVLDAGATETGRPYFVMEYIRGIPILEYCDQERLDTAARLALFANVCQAIQHAHQKGIIHRDIKPSNVLVTLHDGVSVPKVIDFGIAKATNSELTTKTLFTEHRQMIGTPAYMSPEQAEMSGLDIDTRSDVYSLGVLLYELLTGTTPLDTKALLESGYAEMLRAIREDEPHKPSTRISSLGDTGARTAQQRRVELKKLSLLLRGDLDWIVMKCLEKDRTRRYETANGLAADILRHLRDEPVTAGAPSASYAVRKFVRRNRVKVIAASAVLAALVVAIVGTSRGLVEKSRARAAEIQRQLVDEQRAGTENARLTRNADAVDALLAQCEEALREGDTAKARLSLDAARKRSADGGAAREDARLARLAADLELLVELDVIDQFRWTWRKDEFAPMNLVVPRVREALRKFGVTPDVASVESAVAVVKASAVRERIVAALDWVLWERHTPAATRGARALLQRLDDDPFRSEIRDTLLAEPEPDTKRFVELVNRPVTMEQPSEFVAFLGEFDQVDEQRRLELLQAAVIRRPRNLAVLMTLGRLSFATPDPLDELRWCQAALAAARTNFAAYGNLGVALKTNGQLNEAIACDHRALALDPNSAIAYLNLANALALSGQLEAALANHRKSIELAPDDFENYCSLGNTLCRQGRLDEALVALEKSIALEPQHAEAHYTLGVLRQQQGKRSEATAAFAKALELEPAYFEACLNFGTLLRDQGEWTRALDCFEKCIALRPKSAAARANKGCVLADLGRFEEAIAACQGAIEADPAYAPAYFNLGGIYVAQSSDEAIPMFRKAIEADPNHAEAHCNLAQALRNQGHLEEALAEYERAHALGSLQPNWKHPTADWIRDTRVELAKAARLETNLPDLLAGRYTPRDNVERLEFASVCQNKKLHCASTRLYVEAFVADPKAAEEVEGRCLRYNAACVAILCAAGRGNDATNVGDDESARLRAQALAWLRADVQVATERLARRGTPPDAWARWFCNHSLRNVELVSVREPAELAQLPADEQAAFTQLWAEIAALAQNAPNPLPIPAQAEAPPAKRETRADDELDEAKRLRGLSSEQFERRKFAEAEATQRRSLAIFQRILPGDHEDVAGALRNLARILWEGGRPADAEPFAQQALEMLQRLHPGDNADVALAFHTLGTIRLDAGRVAEAVPPSEAALAMNRRRLPADHPDVLATITSLGRACYFAGDFERATSLYEEALNVQAAKLGRDDLQTLGTIGNVGANYRMMGRVTAAIPLLEEAWAQAKQHPELRFVDTHLLAAYIQIADTARALALLDELLADARATRAKASPELAASLATFGLSLLDLRAWDRAEELLREALAIRQKEQPDAWTTFNTQSALGGALLGQQKLAEAEPPLLAGYRGMKTREANIPPQGAARIPQALERLVQLCEAKGDASGAAAWRTELAAARARATMPATEGGKR